MKIFRGAAIAAVIAGSMLSVNAHAVNIATDGIGEVAIAPYYTARDGWQTLINLTNTQNVPIVVKVRFHESLNSRDVLDFTVALSAFDVWGGIVMEDDAGNTVFQAKDSQNAAGLVTCTIPRYVAEGTDNNPLVGSAALVPLSRGGYTGLVGDNDSGPTDNDRLKEGYIEFIVMGYADDSVAPAGTIDVYEAIENHDCEALDTAFDETLNPASGEIRIIDTARQLGEPINALKFNFRLINPARGIEAGAAATTWANFFNPGLTGVDQEVAAGDSLTCTTYRGDERLSSEDRGDDPSTPGIDEGVQEPRGVKDWLPGVGNIADHCQNLVTAQREFAFLDPTLNDVFPVVANFFDDAFNLALTATPTLVAANGPRGIDALSATIMRSNIMNEWVAKADEVDGVPTGFGVTSDWIVTQPTKSFYVDEDVTATLLELEGDRTTNNLQSAIVIDNSAEAHLTVGHAPFAPYYDAFQVDGFGEGDIGACHYVTYAMFDRAEQSPLVIDPVTPPSGVIVSPAPPEEPEVSDSFEAALCYEANVVTFNGGSALGSALNRLDIDTDLDIQAFQTDETFTATNGWMSLFLNVDQGFGTPTLPLDVQDPVAAAAVATGMEGLPVIGFMLKVRTFEADLENGLIANYASSVDHSYLRAYAP